MSIILGIDFGTSNTCISYFNGSDYHIIPNQDGKYTTPSCIYFNPYTSEILYGEIAYNFPQNSIYNIKRLFGITYSEFKSNTQLQYFFKHLHVIKNDKSDYCCIQLLHNNILQTYPVEYISQLFLQHIISCANIYLNTQIKNAVITVPVQFTHVQRNIFKRILQNINIDTNRILNEPTAATLAYIYKKHTTNESENLDVLVIDCGGGTTDFTILECDYIEMYFEVKQTYGDLFLGGEDITNNLVNHVLCKIPNNYLTTKQISKIRDQCEKCKCNLSFNMSSNIFINETEQINISRSQFIFINNEVFKKIKLILEQINVNFNINKVIFVGGTTRIPYFSTIIKQIFSGSIIIQNDLNPDYTVSIGAAIQGYLLTNNTSNTNLDITFLDIVPMSFGVETIGGIMAPIISRGTILPVSKTSSFIGKTDTAEIDINIFQGERRLVSDNYFLGSLKIKINNNITNTIQVTFDINSDGILIVTAKEKINTNEQTLVVTDFLKSIDEKYIYTDDFEKIQDSEISNKILEKIELDNIFQTFSYKYKQQISQNIKLKLLLDEISDIIINFKSHTTKNLNTYRKTFLESWHKTCINLI